MGHFDPECVWRSPDEQDLSEGGSVYELVWGRRHSPELLDYLGSVYDVRYFIVGHRPQEYGYSIYHGRLVVLASDNNHGVFLPLDCQKRYTIDEIEARIRPFVGVV